MKKYIETVGKIIEAQARSSPENARKLLDAAYSWVRFPESTRGTATCAVPIPV